MMVIMIVVGVVMMKIFIRTIQRRIMMRENTYEIAPK